LGIFLYLFFMGYIISNLFKHRPTWSGKPSKIHWLYISCLGTMSVMVISGMFNSVLTNEMGSLTMVVTGFFMRDFTRSPQEGVIT